MDSYEVVGTIRFANGDLHSEVSYGTYPDREQAREKCRAVRARKAGLDRAARDDNEYVRVRRVRA